MVGNLDEFNFFVVADLTADWNTHDWILEPHIEFVLYIYAILAIVSCNPIINSIFRYFLVRLASEHACKNLHFLFLFYKY